MESRPCGAWMPVLLEALLCAARSVDDWLSVPH